MCRTAPADCAGDRRPGGAPFVLSAATRADLSRINRQVNQRIIPKSDFGDTWSAHATTGDCEDYALAKKRALIALGWAPSQVLIAVVTDPQYGAHAVLIARTDQGDLVLDNLTDRILPWDRTRLIFVSRQSAKLPAMWVRL